jgi:hypothetical protein
MSRLVRILDIQVRLTDGGEVVRSFFTDFTIGRGWANPRAIARL